MQEIKEKNNHVQSIVFKLCSVCVHIEDVHLLLWADLTNFSVHFPYVLSNFLSLYDIDGIQ
jgi:hypothetical protein